MANIIFEALGEKIKDPANWAWAVEKIYENKDTIKEYIPNNLGKSEHKEELDQIVPEPKKLKSELINNDREINNNNMINQIHANQTMDTNSGPASTPSGIKSAGGAASGIGFRGELHGATELHKEYAKHFHEIHDLHSRKVKNYSYTWGFATQDVNANSPLKKTNIKIPGLATRVATIPGATVPLLMGYGQGNIPNTLPNAGGANTYTDPASMIYTQPINLRVVDFIDNKLIDTTTPGIGLMSQYQKFRLRSFSIEISPRTFVNNILAMYPYDNFNNQIKIAPNSNVDNIIQKDITEIDMDYWVLRDVYNDFTTSAFPTVIPAIPPESENGASQDQYSRTIRSIRGMDTYLSIMNNKTPFKFTREVNTKGNYYYTQSDLANLMTTLASIDVVVNALEGITGQPGGPNPLPEGFNLLFGPTQAPYFYSNIALGTANQPDSFTEPTCWANITTELYVKFICNWEGFDFKYGLAAGPNRMENNILSDYLKTNIENYFELIRRLKYQRNSLC